jgi:HSP20 family protein
MNYLTTKTYRPVNLINDMDRMFNHLFENTKAPSARGFAADIAESAEEYRVLADMPGFTAADVDVRVEDNLLVIEAKVLENTAEEGKDADKTAWHLKERVQGDRKRSFLLPDDVDKSAVEARMNDGVLTVLLKKKPEAKPFSIKVNGK